MNITDATIKLNHIKNIIKKNPSNPYNAYYLRQAEMRLKALSELHKVIYSEDIIQKIDDDTLILIGDIYTDIEKKIADSQDRTVRSSSCNGLYHKTMLYVDICCNNPYKRYDIDFIIDLIQGDDRVKSIDYMDYDEERFPCFTIYLNETEA